MHKEKAEARKRARQFLNHHAGAVIALPSEAVGPVMASLAEFACVSKRALLVEFASMRRKYTQRP